MTHQQVGDIIFAVVFWAIFLPQFVTTWRAQDALIKKQEALLAKIREKR